MKLTDGAMRLYAVTDRREGKDLMQQIDDALAGGVTILQLREKDMPEAEFLAEAKAVRELCKKYRVPFIINDNVAVAKAADADGVHLGQDDMPIAEARKILGDDKIIGISCHNREEAVKAEADGADYIGSGAVFSTSTKNDVSVLKMSELKEICESVKIPVAAIGGIGYDNICRLSGTKISGVAVASAIFAPKDTKGAAMAMKILAESIVEED